MLKIDGTGDIRNKMCGWIMAGGGGIYISALLNNASKIKEGILMPGDGKNKPKTDSSSSQSSSAPSQKAASAKKVSAKKTKKTAK